MYPNQNRTNRNLFYNLLLHLPKTTYFDIIKRSLGYYFGCPPPLL